VQLSKNYTNALLGKPGFEALVNPEPALA
jgi:hypothetical protein